VKARVKSIDNANCPALFIISPTSKCGTNFLAQALVALGLAKFSEHEVLTREDFLLFHSDLLKRYVDQTIAIWRRWEADCTLLDLRKKQLLASIGNGLLSFAVGWVPTNTLVVMKTPNPQHISNIFELFPGSRLLVLIRDGRDATESQVRAGTFTEYGAAFETWKERIRAVMTFMQQAENQQRSWMLVRYEELLLKPEVTFNAIASFAGHKEVLIDHTIVERLPVFGSSELGTRECSIFRWSVQQKPEDFQPIGRWKAWGLDRRDLFKSIAGKELIELGYANDFTW